VRQDTEDGPLEIIHPEESLWNKFYIHNFFITQDAKLVKAFRNRFRLPYPQFLELVDDIRSNDLFNRWCGYKSNNKRVLPVELLILGLLRYLGRGWTFDDCEESTAIDSDVHRSFFRVFIKFGSTVLYKKWVLTPVNLPEALSNMKDYSEAGFPGCVGSSDCTHIVTDQCEYNLKNNHLGPKNSLTTKTFNLTCNHRCRILHTTYGGPGRWNDQTMVRLDSFIFGICDGIVFDDVSFELFAHDRKGRLIKLRFSGAYVIVDNGYLDWSCTIPPFGVSNNIDKIWWLKWLESMWKDVECTFGIMKGRWRILKSGVRLHGVDAVDSVWFTCCALQNWLLEVDGLTEEWVGGVRTVGSEWEGGQGCLDFEGVPVEVPNALARLSANLDPRNFDSLGVGPGSDVMAENCSILRSEVAARNDSASLIDDMNIMKGIMNGVDHVRSVRFLLLNVFRQLLVNHFAILFSQNKIVWPERQTQKRKIVCV